MKIGRFYWFWEREYESIRRYERRLSKLDDERITKYLDGGHHVHANPRKKEKKVKALPLTAEELQNLLKETADDEPHFLSSPRTIDELKGLLKIPADDKPRHTPEELDRVIETVKEANSPRQKEV